MNGPSCLGNCTCDFVRLIFLRLHHPKGDALGRARADPRHSPELRDQISERGRVFRLSQNGRSRLRRFNCQMERERFQPAQIQLQRRILFIVVGIARLLKLHVCLGPTLFAIKDDAVPK